MARKQEVTFGQAPLVPRAMPEDNALSPMEMPEEQPDVTVDTFEPINGQGVRQLEGGDVVVSLDGDDSGLGGILYDETGDFNENLAEFIHETQLAQIAQDVVEMVQIDLESRAPWYERLAKGLEMLGVVKESDFKPPFEGASMATHPLLAEAVVQFQSRAIAELVPATGPAKCVVLGQKTEQREAKAKRQEEYLNYQLMIEDKVYFPEMDQLLFLLGLEGSEFKKVYTDPVLGRNVTRMIRSEDFIVPYGATTLEDAARFTHKIEYEPNDFRRAVESGFYRDVDVTEPSPRDTDSASATALQLKKDEMEGAVILDYRPEDRPQTVYEMCVDWELPGGIDEQENSGYALPYVISVERDTPKVLSIRRNWRQGDPLHRKKISVIHYPFIRGTGFYGFGFIHMLGGLSSAATGLLRLMIDNGAFAGLQGGFKSKEAKLTGPKEMSPGRWLDTDMTAEELNRSFYTPPYKDVPVSLFNLLGLIVEGGQRFAGTTEAVVGDAKNTGPVGTTVALIEQGSKVFSAIHKRLHFAQGEELKLLAELNANTLPEEGYPYDVAGGTRMVMASDFDGTAEVQPVSDPNIFSATQRIAIAQATLQLATEFPDQIDRHEAVRRVLDAMNAPDIDALLIDHDNIPRYDVITEGALMRLGKPVRAYIDQDHRAHMAFHQGDLQMMAMSKQLTPQLQSVMMAHLAEHQAFELIVRIAAAAGIPPMMVDPYAKKGKPMGQQLPPQIEQQISARAAMAMQQMVQRQQQMQPTPEQIEEQRAQREDARAEQKAKLDAAIRQAESKQKMTLAKAEANAKAALKRFEAMHQMRLEQAKAKNSARAQAREMAHKERMSKVQGALDAAQQDRIHALEKAKSDLEQALARERQDAELEMKRKANEASIAIDKDLAKKRADTDAEIAKENAKRSATEGEKAERNEVKQATAALEKAIKAVTDGFTEMADALSAEREIVTDSEGNPTGTKVKKKAKAKKG